MRRIGVLLLLAALAGVNLGCVIVLRATKFPPDGRFVEIDGEVYLVDEDEHRVKRIEVEATTRSEAGDPDDQD